MKKIRLLLVLFLITLIGCEKNKSYLEYDVLSPDTKEIKDTMLNFFELDRPVFKERNFQVKVIDIVAIEKNDTSNNIMYYLYNLVIAPVTEMPIDIKSILIQSQDEQYQSYFNKNQSGHGLGNLKEWNLLTSNLEGFKFDEVKDLSAYNLITYINNMGQNSMDINSMTKENIDDAVSNFEIVVEYNDTIEIIKVNDITIHYFNPELNLEILDRFEISELYYHNKINRSFDPYRP